MNSSSAQTTTAPSDKIGFTSYLAIVAIAIGYILNPINGSLVMTAYPHLAQTFDVPYAHMSAMVMYFMAATAATQPLAGGLGDSIGRKNLFIIGLIGFTAASVLAALSNTFTSLLVWRMVQAVFSGVILANALGLVGQVIPAAKTGRYLGVLNSTMVGATAMSFPLGGVLVEHFDWPILFWINLPLGVLALILAVLFIPKDRPKKVNFTGVSFIGLPFLPLAFVLQALVQGSNVFPALLVFLATIAAVAVGIFRPRRSRQQFKSINNRSFNLGCCTAYFTSSIQFGVMFTLPAWTLVMLGINSGTLGLYLSGFSLAMFVVSLLLGHFIDRWGIGIPKWMASTCLGAGLLVLIMALTTFSFALVSMSIGAGIGMSLLISQRSAMLAAPAQSQALAMGLFSSWRSIGGLSGNAVAALVLSGYSQVTVASGVDVFQWLLLIFFVPLVVSFYFLRDLDTSEQSAANNIKDR